MTGSGTNSSLSGFSYVLAREGVPAEGLDVKLAADAAALEALKVRFDLESLDRLEAAMVVSPWRKAGLKVDGTLQAELAQRCVVTLEPVPVALNERFSMLFRPEAGERPKEHEIAVDPLADEPPDVLPPEGIDLGEAVAEQLALMLDPYPKAPDARYEPQSEDDSGSFPEGQGKPNPFSVLKNLKSVKDDPS